MSKLKTLFIFLPFIFSSLSPLARIFAQPLSIISPTPLPPVEYALPYPGILPTHPLYFLKQLRDNLLLFFTRDPVKKSGLNLLLADKNLVMGEILWQEGNTSLSLATLAKGEKYLLTAISSLLKQEDIPPGMADKLELSAKKHEEIITRLLLNTSEEAKRQRLTEVLSITHQAKQQTALLK